MLSNSPTKVANLLKNSHSLSKFPGPGYYEVSNFRFSNEKEAVGSSMFKSDSVRDLGNVKRGPGPAFYKNPLQPDPKKMFNFNPGK